MSTDARSDRGPSGPAPDPERVRSERGDDPLFIVGLIGRAGSGKSTLARALAGRGIPVLDADRIGHEVVEQDAAVRAALIADYGPSVFLAGGRLDRPKVAARVFRDRDALAKLNALVHPRIVAGLRERLEALRREGHRGPVIVDAALILSWGFERECDLVLAVTAPESELISRLKRARGWSEEDIRARLAAQSTPEALAAAADVVIENTGSEEEMVAKALAALSDREAR